MTLKVSTETGTA